MRKSIARRKLVAIIDKIHHEVEVREESLGERALRMVEEVLR